MTITVEDLLHERRGYEIRGLTDRVAQVDAAIERLAGVKVETVPDDAPVDAAPASAAEVETGEADADADLETADAAPAKGRRRP